MWADVVYGKCILPLFKKLLPLVTFKKLLPLALTFLQMKKQPQGLTFDSNTMKNFQNKLRAPGLFLLLDHVSQFLGGKLLLS